MKDFNPYLAAIQRGMAGRPGTTTQVVDKIAEKVIAAVGPQNAATIAVAQVIDKAPLPPQAAQILANSVEAIAEKVIALGPEKAADIIVAQVIQETKGQVSTAVIEVIKNTATQATHTAASAAQTAIDAQVSIATAALDTVSAAAITNVGAQEALSAAATNLAHAASDVAKNTAANTASNAGWFTFSAFPPGVLALLAVGTAAAVSVALYRWYYSAPGRPKLSAVDLEASKLAFEKLPFAQLPAHLGIKDEEEANNTLEDMLEEAVEEFVNEAVQKQEADGAMFTDVQIASIREAAEEASRNANWNRPYDAIIKDIQRAAIREAKKEAQMLTRPKKEEMQNRSKRGRDEEVLPQNREGFQEKRAREKSPEPERRKAPMLSGKSDTKEKRPGLELKKAAGKKQSTPKRRTPKGSDPKRKNPKL